MRRLLDLLLPPRCPACGETTGVDQALCPRCWGDLTFLAPPWCAVCGLPFAVESDAVGDGAVCGGCAARAPPFDRMRAALAYDAASRGMILGLKHGDRTDTVPALTRLVGRLARSGGPASGLIVPVPLHRRRLWHRRFNQSALIACALGRELDVPVIADALVRHRPTPSQKGMSARQRHRNVAGAFGITGRHRDRLQGVDVLLIDDVVTTGATATACAAVLRRSGARTVTVLALARVIDPGPRVSGRDETA